MTPEEVGPLLQKAFPPAPEDFKARVLAEAEARLARRRRMRILGRVGLLMAALVLAAMGFAILTRAGGDNPAFERPPEMPLEAGEE